MHGDDVGSAGIQIASQTTSEVLQLIMKILMDKHEEVKRLKALQKSNDGIELNGEQKTLAELKKGGEITSVKLSQEDYEAFKKIDSKKYNDDVAFTAIKDNNGYIELHYLKSDSDTVKSICDEVVANKLNNSKDGYNMIMIPREKAETMQEICANNKIDINLMETPEGEIKCIFKSEDEHRVQKALENTDGLHSSLDKLSADVISENGKPPKIQITDIEQNKSISMKFGDKQKFERVLQDQFGYSKEKAIAASNLFSLKLSAEQKDCSLAVQSSQSSLILLRKTLNSSLTV